MKNHTSKVATGEAYNRHSLHDGVPVSFVLSPVIGLCCHRRRRDAKAPSPT
jgi:hypothetical protein